MAATASPSVREQPPLRAGLRPRLVSGVRAAIEVVVLVLVAAAPWVYGAVHLGFEFLLLAGVALVLALWGGRMLLEGQLTWARCPVTLCLAGLFVLGVWQVTPLSRPVLSRVSPGTRALYDQLLPRRPEVLPPGPEGGPAVPPAGQTISLYPAATRAQLVRLLAVFLLFAAVRNNIAPQGGLRRLGLVAVVNGAALSLFGLVQALSSPPNLLYWSYPSLGQVFGPFICRNHFPFYVNLCIGLGAGLLLSRAFRPGRGGLDVLRDPAVQWVGAALALMAAAVAFSLSRGGLLALVGALVCLLLARRGGARSARGAGLAVVGLAVLLAGWLGSGLVEERLATLWKGEASQSRLPLWERMAPLARDFPLWGTGLGTFSHMEGLRQEKAEDSRFLAEHAHNDYLEVLLEGGIPGLVLALLAVGLVFRLGFRAARSGDPADRGLALGALAGFAALAIQSFVDFGLHIPAVALLATVLSAHLCSLGASGGEYRLRLGGAAGMLGAVTSVALGLSLVGAGWQAHRVDRLRLAASRAGTELEEEGLAEQVGYLEQAARLAPRSAEVQAELGRARLKVFERTAARQKRRRDLLTFAAALPAGRGDWGAALGWFVGVAAERGRDREGQDMAARRHLVAALRDYLHARARCPLLSEPHLVLATQAGVLEAGDSLDAYLDRVKLLSPGDPETWFLCGVQELAADEPGRAWASWRHCLDLSDRYLPQVLALAGKKLGSGELLESVLPDRPGLLLAAATRLYPGNAGAQERRPFLEKAVRRLDERGASRPEDLHTLALAHRGLGHHAEAAAAYRRLLEKDPRQGDWRCELAQVLYDQGQLEEARRELVVVLTRQPDHVQARELLALVGHELARQRSGLPR